MERTNTVGYRQNDEDARAVGELAEDARDAAIKYQVSPNLPVTIEAHRLILVQISQQNAIYEQNCRLIVSSRCVV